MAETDLSITNLALLAVEGDLITSFDEDSTEAETSRLLYNKERDALLGRHDWNFAKRKVKLARKAESPIADWANIFAVPSDYIKNVSAGEGALTRGVDFDMIDGAFHTNSNTMILHYIRRASEADFPPHFITALVACLEAAFIMPLGSGSRSEMLERKQLALDEINSAIVIDMRENSPRRIRGGRQLINCRM